MYRLAEYSGGSAAAVERVSTLVSYLLETVEDCPQGTGLRVDQIVVWLDPTGDQQRAFKRFSHERTKKLIRRLPYITEYPTSYDSGAVSSSFTCDPAHMGEFMEWLGKGHILPENDVYEIYLLMLMGTT